jgi:hypothetical protein
MGVADIKNMNIQDRLLMMEALWNSFLNEEADIESPSWHQDILEKRICKILEGRAEFISIKEIEG